MAHRERASRARLHIPEDPVGHRSAEAARQHPEEPALDATLLVAQDAVSKTAGWEFGTTDAAAVGEVSSDL